MNRYLIYSDLHWSKNSSLIVDRGEKYSKRLENCIKSMNWVYDLAYKFHCDAVISCGDFFDRPNLNSEEISALGELNNHGLKEWFLIGNHEASNLDLSFSSTNVFTDQRIIKELTKLEINNYIDFYFIPYIQTTKSLDLKDYIERNNKKKIIFSHNDLAGISYQKGLISNTGFDIESIYNNCTLFLNGHLHNKFIQNNVFNLGNLTGKNLNEDCLKYNHCAYLLTVDNDKISIEEIENPHAYNFLTYSILKLEELDNIKNINNLVLSLKCPQNLLNDARLLLDNFQNVETYKIIVDVLDIMNKKLKLNKTSIVDYNKEFIKFAKEKLGESEILDSELSLLIGG